MPDFDQSSWEQHMRDTVRVMQELWQAEEQKVVVPAKSEQGWYLQPMGMDEYLKRGKVVDQGPTKEERDDVYWKVINRTI